MGQQQNGRPPPLVRIDRRYNQPYRLTGYDLRAAFKWTGLIFAWMIVGGIFTAGHVGGLSLFTTAALIWYAIHCARRGRGPQAAEATYQTAMPDMSQREFRVPPNWPAAPVGWSPPLGWLPDTSWPPAPPGWEFWVPVVLTPGPVGERNTRTIPQDVKIAVSAPHEIAPQLRLTGWPGTATTWARGTSRWRRRIAAQVCR